MIASPFELNSPNHTALVVGPGGTVLNAPGVIGGYCGPGGNPYQIVPQK
jgi:hypothetical protein